MKHLLVTRYNVTFGAAAQQGIDGLDPDWLAHRDHLFRTYCVPSVQLQDRRDFEWILLFHPRTPPRYFNFLDGIARVVLTPSTLEARKAIVGRRLLRAPMLISRIDNDDCIATDFVSRTRNAAERAIAGGRRDFVVLPQKGAFADLASRRWRPVNMPSPPFLSLFEGFRLWRERTTPLELHHARIPERYPVVPIDDGPPLWLGLVHGRNVVRRWHAQDDDRDLVELVDRFPALAQAQP
jgi:hypothetical protein